MRINRRPAIIGLIIFLVPFLGLPDTWKFAIFIILGLGIIIFSVEFLQPKKKVGRKVKNIKIAQSFAENGYMDIKSEVKPQSGTDSAEEDTHVRIYE